MATGNLVAPIEQVLAQIGFAPSLDVRDLASIVNLIRRTQRCGIYVLHFANDWYYVGQSVQVADRYLAHRQNYPDIERFSFKQVPRPDLVKEESLTIQTLEADFRLKNIEGVRWAAGPSALDAVFSPKSQNHWLADVAWKDLAGDRAVDLTLRERTSQKFARLRQIPEAEAAIELARLYIQRAVPAPRRTEMQFWSVSCLPQPWVYLRVNIHKQEVFAISGRDGQLRCWLYLAKLSTVERQKLLKMSMKKHAIACRNEGYASGGADQMYLEVTGTRTAAALLGQRSVLAAARRFNLGLMLKGPSLNRESHCIDLATRLVE